MKNKFGYGSSELYLISRRRELREMDYVGINSSSDCGDGLNSSLALPETEEYVPRYNACKGLERLRKERAGKTSDVYKPEEFALSDILWAKCWKRYLAWPAIVIDPILQAPESVLSRVPGAICYVLYYGYSKNGTHRIVEYNAFGVDTLKLDKGFSQGVKKVFPKKVRGQAMFKI